MRSGWHVTPATWLDGDPAVDADPSFQQKVKRHMLGFMLCHRHVENQYDVIISLCIEWPPRL